jgi:hypothetical protein
VTLRRIEPFCPFAHGVARRLAQDFGMASEVHWGNPGFRIDVALRHPGRPGDVTVGLLCDFARYTRAPDPVEWDVFRTAVHAGQGWTLHRIWTPQFFRDPQGALAQVRREVQRVLGAGSPAPSRGAR